MTRVASTDGVELAVFDLGGTGPALLLSHATGFHGRCYGPLAEALGNRFHSVTFDYRGHGDTRRPPGPVDWERYADDAVAMAVWLRDEAGAPIDAFGHSMGGACLLMAAHRDPSLFRRLVVFEPIVFPPTGLLPDGEGSPLAAGARRRRASFASYDEAIANYASKRPLGGFTPAALEAYVRHGFAPGEDGQIHLKCRPETEAETFETGGNHQTWAVLPEIATPVLVITGAPAPFQPSSIAADIAARLPNSAFLADDTLDHFGPMTHPDLVASQITAYL